MGTIKLHRPLEGSVPTLTAETIVDLYLAHCEVMGVHSPAARADREYTFRLFCQELGGIPVADLKTYHLSEWVESHREWKSTSTRRAKANAIRAAFNWAAKQERIPKNPFANVRYAENERRAEMPDDALGQLERVASKQFEAVLRFLRLTWCRTGELCRATWADVDLDRGIWTIAKHKSRRFTGKPKIIALVPEAVGLLRAIMAGTHAAPAEAVSAGFAFVGPSGPIFLNTRGKPWTPGVLGYQLRRLKQRHGIQGGCLHGIRHKGITAALENGAPLLMVAEQAGHATPAITVKNYWHRSQETLAAMRDAASLGVPRK